MNKKLIATAAALLTIALMLGGCTPTPGSESDPAPTGGEVLIALANGGITVDGGAISTDAGAAVYLTQKTETHPDATKEVANSVITITRPGTYRLSGQGADTQILVDIAPELTDPTTLVLDNFNISCATAPALLIWSAAEAGEAGTGSVTVELAEGSHNTLSGSHTATDEANGITEKNDAALSSNVSFVVGGTGSLIINADSEGIEGKMHVTFNGGNIQIYSHDDAINGSGDGVSHITINGGTILASSTLGAEGDGIDSNGYLTINGGTVYAFGNAKSMDSGLDAEFSIAINGGTVIAAGNMYDDIAGSDSQQFIALQFAQGMGDRITLVDVDGVPVFSFLPEHAYSTFVFSSPDLIKSEHTLYSGGEVTGEAVNGLTLTPASFSGGTQLQGAASQGGRGMMGGAGDRPARELPEGATPPAGDPAGRPEGAQRPEGQTPPDFTKRPGTTAGRPGQVAGGTASEVFDLAQASVFSGITAVQGAS